MLTDCHILENVYQQIIICIPMTKQLITDTFTVKSMRESDGLGRYQLTEDVKDSKYPSFVILIASQEQYISDQPIHMIPDYCYQPSNIIRVLNRYKKH